MKLIAHRGLITGPNKHIENQPATIKSALDNGFDCEIDLWVFDCRLYLGHDGPQYNITKQFLEQSGLWIHCKNLNALEYCSEDKTLNYFWHENDTYTLTSQGIIWAYPGKELTPNSICVMPEWNNPSLDGVKEYTCYGICSDYVGKLL
jgi:hypothetical protein